MHWVAVVVMILGSLPYIRYVQLVSGNARPILRDSQIRAYLRWLAMAKAPYSTKLPGSTRSSRFSRAVRWLVLRRRATASMSGDQSRASRSGCTVVRSILFEYTRIAADMRFTEMIVSPDYCVDRHGDTLYRGDDTSPLRGVSCYIRYL